MLLHERRIGGEWCVHEHRDTVGRQMVPESGTPLAHDVNLGRRRRVQIDFAQCFIRDVEGYVSVAGDRIPVLEFHFGTWKKQN